MMMMRKRIFSLEYRPLKPPIKGHGVHVTNVTGGNSVKTEKLSIFILLQFHLLLNLVQKTWKSEHNVKNFLFLYHCHLPSCLITVSTVLADGDPHTRTEESRWQLCNDLEVNIYLTRTIVQSVCFHIIMNIFILHMNRYLGYRIIF